MIRSRIPDLAERSNLRAVLALTIDWGIIFAAVLVSEWTKSSWVYCLSIVVISRQMNALFELHHQAIHGNLFRAGPWNERLDWLYSIPLLSRVGHERGDHMAHHRGFSVENGDHLTWGTGYGLQPSRRSDRAYMTRFLLIRPFVGFLQFQALREILRNPNWKQPSYRNAVLTYWAVVLSSLAVAGKLDWVLWYWFIPYFTAYQTLFFWDDMIGHFNCPRTGTRDMRGFWFRLFATHGTAYHNVHHIYPMIPWFRQRRATAELVDERSMDVACGFRDAIRQMVIACDRTAFACSGGNFSSGLRDRPDEVLQQHRRP